MTLRHALASLLLLGATPSLAAGRIPYGGELRDAHTGPAEPGEPDPRPGERGGLGGRGQGEAHHLRSGA